MCVRSVSASNYEPTWQACKETHIHVAYANLSHRYVVSSVFHGGGALRKRLTHGSSARHSKLDAFFGNWKA